VAGDPAIDFTETHQVIVDVSYGRGPEIAQRLEANNIICNYQAGPDEESFTASGALRLGVSEMTRFGMQNNDFRILAELINDVVYGDHSGNYSSASEETNTLMYCRNCMIFYKDLLHYYLSQIYP
jgi:aminomethyltransferase